MTKALSSSRINIDKNIYKQWWRIIIKEYVFNLLALDNDNRVDKKKQSLGQKYLFLHS